MGEIFGIGIEELIFVGILIALLFGPESIPKMARTAGRALNRLFRSPLFRSVKSIKLGAGLTASTFVAVAWDLIRLPSSGGIAPLNWLLSSLNSTRLVRLPSSGRMGPVNWLLDRYRCNRPLRLPSSGGIAPLN